MGAQACHLAPRVLRQEVHHEFQAMNDTLSQKQTDKIKFEGFTVPNSKTELAPW